MQKDGNRQDMCIVTVGYLPRSGLVQQRIQRARGHEYRLPRSLRGSAMALRVR